MTKPADISFKKLGTPFLRTFPILSKFIPPSSICMVLFFFIKCIDKTPRATNCPIDVAKAAPNIPRLNIYINT